MRWFQRVVWNWLVYLIAPICTQPWSHFQIWFFRSSSWCISSPAVSNTPRIPEFLSIYHVAHFQRDKYTLIIYTKDYADCAWEANTISNPAQSLTYPLFELALTDSPRNIYIWCLTRRYHSPHSRKHKEMTWYLGWCRGTRRIRNSVSVKSYCIEFSSH